VVVVQVALCLERTYNMAGVTPCGFSQCRGLRYLQQRMRLEEATRVLLMRDGRKINCDIVELVVK